MLRRQKKIITPTSDTVREMDVCDSAAVLPLTSEVNIDKPPVCPQPAWQDDDDNDEKQEIRNNKLEEVLGGAPMWARLKWERLEDEEDESTDSSDEEDVLYKRAIDFSVVDKSALPKDVLDIVKCKRNANHEQSTKGRVTSVEFHPSAQVILTAGRDKNLNFFQVDGEHNALMQSVKCKKPILIAHFSNTGEEVLYTSYSSHFNYYDLVSGKTTMVHRWKGIEEKSLSNFKVSPAGDFLVFLGNYGRMHIISAITKEWMHTLQMNGSVNDVAFSETGTHMYSIGDDGVVYIWDMKTFSCLHKFTDDGCVKGTAIDISRNSQFIATGSYSGIVNIYKTEACMKSAKPQPVKFIKNLMTPCTMVKFNSTSEILAASSEYQEQALKLVHLPSCRIFKNFPTGFIKSPTCLDFSLNSGYFVIGNDKGKALLYRLKHYEQF